jgi:hypothetical protein
VFGPAFGVHTGVFVPFYLSDRFVLRAEVGASALRGRSVSSATGPSSSAQVSVTAAVLGRYYASRHVCLVTGVGWVRSLSEPRPVAMELGAELPKRMDLTVLLGAAYRFTPRVEVGVRYGRGVMTMLDAGPWGPAHHRYGSLVTSYLLHNARPKLIKRQHWRSELGNCLRY